jgi:hypothetical protein
VFGIDVSGQDQQAGVDSRFVGQIGLCSGGQPVYPYFEELEFGGSLQPDATGFRLTNFQLKY